MQRLSVVLLAAITLVHAIPASTAQGESVESIGKSPLWNATWVDHLKSHLLTSYDKFARPAQHTNTTEVQFSIIITHVEVDVVRSLMILKALTRMEWDDEKLKWNPSDYGGITYLHVADHEIWQPDIVLYNSALGDPVDHYGDTHRLVLSNGHVIWVPPSKFSVFCDINLRKWPYDQHTCYFYFGSWVHNGDQLLLKKPTNRTWEDEIETTPMGWTVVSFKETEHAKYFNCCTEPFYNIKATVTVKRKSPSYIAVVFIPAIVCAVLTLAVFCLPPHASEKFLLSGVTTVIICMFLIYFAQQLPTLGQNMPLIVEFYSYNLLLVGLSVAVSILSVNLSGRPKTRPVPWALSKAITNPFAAFLGISSKKDVFVSLNGGQDCEELQERGQLESAVTTLQQSSSQSAREWVLIASALNRLMFLIYLLIFFLIAASFYI